MILSIGRIKRKFSHCVAVPPSTSIPGRDSSEAREFVELAFNSARLFILLDQFSTEPSPDN